MNKYIIFLPFIVILCSCSIHGSFQGLYSYYNQTKQKYSNILIEVDSATQICDLVETTEPKVYITNGIRLKECISPQKDVVFYIWKPKCKGDQCYSLNVLQGKCKVKNIELFIIAEYYDGLMMDLNYTIDRPIFAIDTRYYKTDLTSKYLSKFLYDLTSKKKITGNLVFFKNGVFFKSSNNIDSM